MKIAAVILAGNAEKDMQDCLDSVSFCDEIIVVHGRVDDTTLNTAKKAGARLINESSDSFADKRNVGLKVATSEWIFYIDTDERVTPLLKKSIETAITSEKSFCVYKIQRKNFYLGKNPWPKIEQLERLFKKDHLQGWYGNLHESPKVIGEIGVLEGLLEHYTHKDLSSMLTKTIHWSQMEAQLRFDQHHPEMTWWRFPRVMMTAFWDSYIKQEGYRAGTMGLIESMFQSFSMFITYARLWETQQKRR